MQKNKNFNSDYFYNYTKATSGDIRTVRTEFIGDEKILSENKNSKDSCQASLMEILESQIIPNLLSNRSRKSSILRDGRHCCKSPSILLNHSISA